MITYRPIGAADAEAFWRFLCRLDEETEYMMYEPGERAESGSAERLKGFLARAEAAGDLRLGVWEGEEIAGFISADRGSCRRNAHTAYVVVGIRPPWQHQGLGAELFRRLEAWARERGLARLELTVECPNAAALALYKKSGFEIEGLRRRSMRVNGQFVDEYEMAKLI